MKYQVERIPFPNNASHAVAVENKDGTYTIYENTLCSVAQCEKAVSIFVDEIEKEAAE